MKVSAGKPFITADIPAGLDAKREDRFYCIVFSKVNNGQTIYMGGADNNE